MQPKAVPQHAWPRSGSVDGVISAPAKPQHARHGNPPKHVSAHRPQPTKTLMRRAVKTPTVTVAATAKPAHALHSKQSPLQAKVPAHLAVKPKLSSDVVDPMRARRAKVANRSQAVQHFKPTHIAPTKTFSAIPAAAPSDITVIHPPASLKAAPVRPSRAQAVQDFRRPYAAVPMQNRRAAAPQLAAHQRPTAHGAKPAQHDEAAYEQDLFEKALAHATSHEQPAPKGKGLGKLKRSGRRRKQVLGIVASLSVFVLLFGFIAYQNRDDIQLQLASAKAGFSASMPLYTPEGYKMDKLKYAPGTVSALFLSDDQSFTVTQKKSNWDSQTLLENFVVNSKEDYQGYQSNGRTVYVYGKGNATWVNGGIWYQLKDSGNLSNEQLVKIAASM